MFIKLMRKAGEAIWIKAESIITVEPARTGGTIVVPMGDGLDYEVVEEPETVLALIAGEPPPKPKKATRKATKTKAKAADAAAIDAAAPAEEKPKKKRTTKKKATAEEEEASSKAETPAEMEPTPVFFTADQLARVRKMAPGSVKKLANTLATQFGVSDTNAVVRHLEETGVIAVVEHGHVNWLPPSLNNVLMP